MGSSTTKTRSPKSAGFRGVRRYRINPLELVIFSLVTAGFGYSIYHLFRDNGDLTFADTQPMQTSPTRTVVTETGGSRSIATVSGAVDGAAPTANLIHFEVNCDENPGFQFGNHVCPEHPSGGRILPDTAADDPSQVR